MIDKLLQYGFQIQSTSQNGITWLKKTVDVENQNNVQEKDDDVIYWDGKSKVGSISGFPFNTCNGKLFGNPQELGNSVFFIKDFKTNQFVRVNYNPLYMPLVIFREYDDKVICPVHKRWEEYVEPKKTICGYALKGLPIKLAMGKYTDILDNNVYGFQVTVNPNKSPFIVINYICNKPRKSTCDSYIVQRCIGLNVDGEFDWLSECDPDLFDEKKKKLPDIVYDLVIRIISTDIKNRYGIKIENKNFKKNQDFISAIYAFPFDYNFYFLKDLVPEVMEIDKTNPKCFDLLCEKVGFKSWRTFRRFYNEDYKNFIIIRNAIKMGFRDKNILNKILESDVSKHIFAKGIFRKNNVFYFDDFDDYFGHFENFDYADDNLDEVVSAIGENNQNQEHLNQINYQIERALNEARNANNAFETSPICRFYNSIIQSKGEISAWNLLEKNAKVYINDSHNRINDLFDVAVIFYECNQYFSDEEKQKIFREGFTLYNHNLIVNVMNNHQVTVIDKLYGKEFEYTEKEKSLEGIFNGFEFKLAESPSKLLELGQTLHNCVGSYVKRVFEKNCIIVYATKNGQNRLCIEVRGNLIQQGRADHNSAPTGEELTAFNNWKHKNRLAFYGNHF